ncbi:MAG: phosphoglucosamine mutase [candidate division Zixibacteria bacterium]|nr:phosphoglucosamine mutase [candidate division Zixibacteria bacterium]
MNSKKLLISVSGIRGVVGAEDGLTPETAVRFGAAFGTFCKSGKIIIGSDTRPSRRMIIPAVCAGLIGCGRDIIDLGICPTPTVELAVKKMKAAGGIIITASHNPPEWNALKLLNSKGMFLSSTEGEKLLEIFKSAEFAYKPHNRLGRIYKEEFIQFHIDKIMKLDAVRTRAVQNRKFKVALDCVNGAGALLSPKLLKKLGCRVICLNCEPTGKFGRGPEPVPTNLRKLSTAVKDNGCDIGFAHDPDADRLAIVDENGKAIGEEYTLAFAVDYILSHQKGAVAANLSTSRMIDDIASRYGVKVHRTKVGEINVSLKLKSAKGVIGGEGNGGVIYPNLLYGRDGAVGIALILSYLATTKKTVSEAVAGIPSYVMIKGKVDITKEDIEKKKRRLISAFTDAKLNSDDGFKFEYKDKWIHIRASNTEPISRVIAEAPGKSEAQELIDTVKKALLTQ